MGKKPQSGYRLFGGEKASERYRALEASRESVVERGEELAEITIPALFPPRDFVEGEDLYVPNQSYNAGCVNNLANALMYTSMPPGQPMYAHSILEHKLTKDEANDVELWSKMLLATAKLEVIHRSRAETTVLRTKFVEYLKLLIVTGNALWKHVELDFPEVYDMHHYVVWRDKKGRPLGVIHLEQLAEEELPDAVKEMVAKPTKKAGELLRSRTKETAGTGGDGEQVNIYTCCRWDYDDNGEHQWFYWQELEDGRKVPESSATGDEEVPPPMYPGEMIPVNGHSWGRSYAQEYQGDLFIVENDARSENDGVLAAGWSLVMVNPRGVTAARDVQEADNLDVVSGDPADVQMLQSGKASDLQLVGAHRSEAEKRLGRAFLLYSSIQRPGERVTREEITRMAMDIDRSLGGLHTQIAQTSYKHIVKRFIWLHEDEDSDVPRLPEDENIIRVSVVTGVDALGRSVEGDALVSYGEEMGRVFTPQVVGQRLNFDDFARRLAATKGIKPEGLIKTQEQLGAEQQQAQQQELMSKAAGPLAGQAAGGIARMAQEAMKQQQQ